MKKLIAILLVLAAVVSFAACNNEPVNNTETATTEQPGFVVPPYETPDNITEDTDRVAVTGITIDVSEKSINIHDIFLIKPTVTPADATYPEVFWFSSDTDVVNTLGNGMISGVGNGKATVYARTVDGGFYASCEVTVGTGIKDPTKDPVELTGLKLSETQVSMYLEDNMLLSVTPLPEGAKYTGNYTWATTDASVVSVDVKGRIYANAVGTATIIVSTEDGKFKASCKVTVADLGDEKGVTGITLDVNEKELSVGESFTLVATVKPDHAANKFVLWMSADDKIATVDTNGKVKAVAPGTVKITAMTLEGGFVAECTVTVK